jgi:hypothetical protein
VSVQRRARGDGTFISPPVVTNGTIFAGQGPQVDWNGDGQTDLGGPTGTFYLGQPDDTFTVGPTWSGVSVTGPDQPPDFCGVGRFGVAGSWELLFVGDHYEGISGRLVYGDLAQVNQSFAGLTAGGQLTFPNLYLGSKGTTRCLGVGDFDGDGKPDFAVALAPGLLTTYPAENVTVVYGNGDGTFRSTATTIPSPFSTTGTPPTGRAIDIDGDGLTDLAVVDFSGACQVLWNNGGGTFTAAGSSVPCPGYDASSNAVGDFDGDGVYDILAHDNQVQPTQW